MDAVRVVVRRSSGRSACGRTPVNRAAVALTLRAPEEDSPRSRGVSPVAIDALALRDRASTEPGPTRLAGSDAWVDAVGGVVRGSSGPFAFGRTTGNRRAV